jgi:hypothetical protein
MEQEAGTPPRPTLTPAARAGILCALVPFVAFVGLAILGTSLLDPLVLVVATLFLLMIALAVPATVLLALGVSHLAKAGSRVRWRERLRPATTWAAAFLATTVVLVPCAYVVGSQALRLVTWRASSLVDAIHAYQHARGTPPPTLEDLVPDYLDEIPETGLGPYRPFKYAVHRPSSERAYHWYDLGSREGAETSDDKPWSKGDADHAALVLTTDHANRVSGVRLDRFPVAWEQRPFDPSAWEQERDRIAMARDVASALQLEGRALDEVEAILGLPDGEGFYLTPAWELEVSCGAILDFDRLVYSPSGSYERFRGYYGISRIGDWALIDD